MAENKKPFGLTLACKIAAEAIQKSVAPVSVVLYNLLSLQKDSVFPKKLETQDFATTQKIVPDQDKRVVAKILDKLRMPHLDTAALLEENIKDQWIIKKAPPKEELKPVNKKLATKPVAKTISPKNKKYKTGKVEKKEPVAPVVTIKRNKII